MVIDENTMLVQLEDGLLYYKKDDELILASMTDIQKHYKTMQYNIAWLIGCYATDCSLLVQSKISPDEFEKWFWKIEYQQIPENCTRIK
jgi:hypothetical protein